MSEKDVLLRIYRAYSKEEAVLLLKKEIADLNFNNGELISEVAELKHTINKITHEQDGLKRKKVWSKDELIHQYEERFKKQRGNNNKLEKDLVEWRNRYFSLKATLEKLNSERNPEECDATKADSSTKAGNK